MSKARIFLIFSAACLLLYLPILVNSKLILERGNDLQEFYWPIFYFIREHIFSNFSLPLWNNMFFSGTPLLPDPQSFLFYPPNIIFLILPIDIAFIVSLFAHSLLGGLGAYLVAKYGLGFSAKASVFTGLAYLTFPRVAGFLEAGHYGFVTAGTWLPFLILTAIKLTKRPNFSWSVLLAVSLSGLFFSFTTLFIVSALLFILFIAGSYLLLKTSSVNTLIFSALGIVLTLGLTATVLLPQLEWLPQTTRYILLQDRDVYPKWNGKVEFVKAIFPHIFGHEKLINELDSEKWIASGIFISILALIGFVKLKGMFKTLIIIIVSGTILVSLNNVSPLSSLLLSIDWYVLSRVSTRVWFIVALICVFLAGFGFEILQKGRFKRLVTLLAILTITELIVLSWLRLERPYSERPKVPVSLFEFLKKDRESFRVFCVNRCLSQQDVAKHSLQTIEGYGTIYQKNYYDHFIQLSQVFWDKYSSTLPPISVYQFRQIQPYAAELVDYNVKYVISPYKLTGIGFKFIERFDNFLLYETELVHPRAYFVARGTKSEIEAPVLYYSPNKIVVDTSKNKARELILAEVWSPGWKAILDGEKEVEILQTRNKLRLVNIESDTKSVEFYYNPKSYQAGKVLSLFTLFAILLYLARELRKKGFKRP
ncbi:MAG: hypothetical protein A3F61_00620 [Candidatus Blackburnbacteria bacterium RIFCSPHIGHO2_12_FULL_41_13b]|uniref:Membrane protein 6-pyruvoyl-tetrahydropterin synthase-related domain-containing protein n=1 Tax=Candidatus Blackburnbacteria bacterium RIFCSPHIGHO2_12_FULL_41_13b TaxID=1797517 RepID=A0A1G1VBS3_9BACT|nr:MAG: hypothetical protein A3F61_00620 [Candidatus Blackburnbacteria bacterium RIFCSPHIGHO2_12_FULL_41_13b]